MFILYAVAIGLVLGLVLGGRPAGLADLQIRWPWLMMAGLLAQVALFSAPVTDRIGALGPPIYVASTAAVLVAVLRNIRTAGMPVVALGALSNLVAITANGGVMPTTREALAAAGLDGPGVATNSAIVANPVFQPLTDIFAIPAGVPLANVFSVGDVLIGLGIVLIVAAVMIRRPLTPAGATA